MVKIELSIQNIDHVSRTLDNPIGGIAFRKQITIEESVQGVTLWDFVKKVASRKLQYRFLIELIGVGRFVVKIFPIRIQTLQSWIFVEFNTVSILLVQEPVIIRRYDPGALGWSPIKPYLANGQDIVLGQFPKCRFSWCLLLPKLFGFLRETRILKPSPIIDSLLPLGEGQGVRLIKLLEIH